MFDIRRRQFITLLGGVACGVADRGARAAAGSTSQPSQFHSSERVLSKLRR